MAIASPKQTAAITSKRIATTLAYHSITFDELEALSNRYANGLSQAGIKQGMRTLLMVRQGFDFIALVFALFKIGAVPVLIDPGMGVRRLLDCIRPVNLEAFVGIPLAHVVRTLRPEPFATVKTFVTVGRRCFWGGPTLGQLTRAASARFEIVPTRANEIAAILFTSGSTGPAKGVVYEHGMFDAQIRMIQSTYGIQPGEIDLPTFPLFALFSVAMGMTIVLPDMDLSNPARVNPVNIVDAIRDQKVTNTFGSPALWKRVAAYCVERGITLPTLQRILIAGAPVPPPVIEQLHRVLPTNADVHTPYGATESLPVSTISGCEVVGRALPAEPSRVHLDALRTVALTLSGAGTCVGRPVPATEVRIIQITDDPILHWSEAVFAPTGQAGEICVTGPAITREYFGLPQANSISKIQDGDKTWHRIGDVGYFDELGRLWFCGRKAHRVQTAAGTLFTECIEPVFNQHPAVGRCALVGVGPPGGQAPLLIIESKPGHPRRGRRARALANEILNSFANRQSVIDNRQSFNRSRTIADQQWALFQSQISNLELVIPQVSAFRRFGVSAIVLFRRSLPVDIRHNAKINRELLGAWAAKRTHH